MGKHVHVHLKDEERQELGELVRTGNAPARTQTRARILLLADRSQGQKRTSEEIAKALLCSKSTMKNVCHRFLREGKRAALYDKPRPGQKPKLTGELEAELTLLACSAPPEGHGRWSLRLLADRLIELGHIDYISHVTVGEWLKKTNSSPGG